MVTVDGDTLWVPGSQPPLGYTLPELSSPHNTHQTAMRVIDRVGLSPGIYLGSGALAFPAPTLLATTTHVTYALLVERSAADESKWRCQGQSQLSQQIPTSWRRCPNRPVVGAYTETDIEQYDLDGLRAWLEIRSSIWFRQAVEAAGLQATPPSVTPPPAPPPPSVTSPPSQTPPSRFPAPTGDQAAATAGILRGPEDLNAMYTTDLRALKNEGYLLRDIEKMVGKLPTFPSSEMKKGNEMEELEVLRTAVVKLTEHVYVKTALRTATCREEVLGRMILDMPTLLWMVMDKSLAKPQKLYLEELAPGGSEGEEWQRRFVSVNQFMGDLAFSCGISLDALKRLKTELLAAVQGTSETASAYYTRMSVGWETVNFVADVVEQCTKMSRLELLGTFWAGLTHSTLVGTRLQSLDLDTSYPETWEQKQKQLQRRDTSAILKVRDVATMIEEEKIKEEAALAALISRKMTQHVSAQSSPRIRPTGARPFASGQAPVWKPRPFTPRRPEIAAIKWKEEDDEDSQVALANTQPASKQVRFSPRPANTPSSFTPRERPCFACGKLDHMIADCKDEAAVAKWRADAPARLARRQARVAACVAVLGGEVDENVLDESEFEMLDEVSSLAAMEPEGFAHLCGLCDLGLPEGAFRDGGRSEDVPEARE